MGIGAWGGLGDAQPVDRRKQIALWLFRPTGAGLTLLISSREDCSGHGLPFRLRWRHSRCAPDSCRLAVPPDFGSRGPTTEVQVGLLATCFLASG
jgi:hypothetical protein